MLIDEILRLRQGLYSVEQTAQIESEKYDQPAVAKGVSQAVKHYLSDEHKGSVSDCAKCASELEKNGKQKIFE